MGVGFLGFGLVFFSNCLKPAEVRLLHSLTLALQAVPDWLLCFPSTIFQS